MTRWIKQVKSKNNAPDTRNNLYNQVNNGDNNVPNIRNYLKY